LESVSARLNDPISPIALILLSFEETGEIANTTKPNAKIINAK
jgi:hypothetical protein